MTLPRALYDGLLAEVYDDYTAADSRDDLALWDRLAGECDGPALELGSGTGRVLVPLLAKGYRVEGLDNSPDMLARCRARAADMGFAPVLHLADMTDFALDRTYGLIFCAAGTLTLLAEPGQMEAALGQARAHLAPDALLALAMDAPTPAPEGPVIARDLRRDGDGARLRCVLDLLPSEIPEVARWRMTNEITAPTGETRSDTTEIAFRRPDPARFAQMLRAAGFSEVTIRDATGTVTIRPDDMSFIALARAGPGGVTDSDRRGYSPPFTPRQR